MPFAAADVFPSSTRVGLTAFASHEAGGQQPLGERPAADWNTLPAVRLPWAPSAFWTAEEHGSMGSWLADRRGTEVVVTGAPRKRLVG
jgi:hypothetical protein